MCTARLYQSNVDKPAGRREILALEAQFEASMRHIRAYAEKLEREGGGKLGQPVTIAASADPLFDSDVFKSTTAATALLQDTIEHAKLDPGAFLFFCS